MLNSDTEPMEDAGSEKAKCTATSEGLDNGATTSLGGGFVFPMNARGSVPELSDLGQVRMKLVLDQLILSMNDDQRRMFKAVLKGQYDVKRVENRVRALIARLGVARRMIESNQVKFPGSK